MTGKGRTRPNKRETTAHQEDLSDEIGRKFVASIIDDDKHGRLKVLLRGHAKRAVVTYREVDTKLSLLQFACIVGNVHAAEVLLGLGADKSDWWDFSQKPGGWNVVELKWLPQKTQTRFCAKSQNICDGYPQMCIQPLHHAKLSILHLAALANQQEMVGFLVRNKHMPVDVRAGGTGVTPLMAVAATRCCWLDGESRNTMHTCGHPTSPMDVATTGLHHCASMLPMFDLLLSLGADPDAMDNCNAPVTHGRPEFFEKAKDFLQRLYTAKRASAAFAQQLNEPATELVRDGINELRPRPSHPLLAAMQGHLAPKVPRELLRLGVSLDALCCGLEHMPIDRPCLVQKALAALWHLVQRGEPLLPHAHVIMALFINCCQAEYMPVLENDSTKAFAMKYADLLQLMYREGLDFREECCLGDTEFVNRPGPDGRLPLVVAVKDRNHELCKMLVEAGADVLLAQKDNVCPLWACATARASNYAMLVHDDRLILLLATTGAQVNLVYTGDTPLRSACLRPHEDNRDQLVTCLVTLRNPALTLALTERDNEHGLTVLGLAVAWGHRLTIFTLADACKREGLELAPLLERHTERSVFHAPLFTAVTHNYQGVLATLFDHGLQLTPAISTEHLLLSPEARLPGARPSGREFVRQPRPGETESLSLLMCAASVGNQAAMQQLHGRGVALRDPFPGNRWYRNAITAAIDFPDLPGCPGGEGIFDGSITNMGNNQLMCALALLQDYQEAMTEDQMYKLLNTVYEINHPKMGADIFNILRQNLAMCRRCKLVGYWRKCAGCKSTFYCGVDCQAADWFEHRKQCKPPKA
ncbi:hypothetical protein WJX75_009965 [Coccomyxa subellipsoidea]|uniref:MYND-type domain-containing protein n=1 Tax=Coccomyxa subellipsoidea TaxID=248742 RepID=A0ABR2YNG1_9CHLO